MGALGSLLGGLGGPREPWPGSLPEHVGRSYPPPSEIARVWDPPLREEGKREKGPIQLEKEDRTTGKREKCKMGTKDHNREERRV